MTLYVIRHRESGRYWQHGPAWTPLVSEARTFAFMTDAEFVGIMEVLGPLSAWSVVPISDGLPIDPAPDAHMGGVEA